MLDHGDHESKSKTCFLCFCAHRYTSIEIMYAIAKSFIDKDFLLYRLNIDMVTLEKVKKIWSNPTSEQIEIIRKCIKVTCVPDVYKWGFEKLDCR